MKIHDKKGEKDTLHGSRGVNAASKVQVWQLMKANKNFAAATRA